MTRAISRRTFLRGTVGGAAISVGLPLLDCFLTGNGDALADGGALPVRFGTWFWGCGMNPDRWIPAVEGPDYELSPELQALAPVKQHVNVISGLNTILDGRANYPHSTGILANITGTVSGTEGGVSAPSVDVLISREIGKTTRFRSIEMAATGRPTQTYSIESEAVRNASAVSPLELYSRIFGAGFADPNAGSFVPDPRLVLRRSALSAIKDDVARLESRLGSHDRQRLDQYLTAIRQLELQLDVSLSGPPDLDACRKPPAPRGEDLGTDLPQTQATHEMMTELLVFALLCDQTRVFNMLFSWSLSELRLPGAEINHHQLTHDEGVDQDLGYQPRATEFALASMDALAGFVARLAAEPEGAGSLLDSCLVMAHSDSSFAKSHDVNKIPFLTAGRAGGRIRTGLHVALPGEPASRMGLTMQQVMGLQVGDWGTGSMQVNRPIDAILA
ncbi:MAG: DUF1552 domain-containing protein [Deltaproteobacteria bacterium]|nr:DUF1552 domain-containing protein [Deltaproteobacteria bacterium]